MWAKLSKRQVAPENGQLRSGKSVSQRGEQRRFAICSCSVRKNKCIAVWLCRKMKKAAN